MCCTGMKPRNKQQLCATKKRPVEGHRKALQIREIRMPRVRLIREKKGVFWCGGPVGGGVFVYGRSECWSAQQTEEPTVL